MAAQPGYPSDQGNPGGAIPVYIGGSGVMPLPAIDEATAIGDGTPIVFGTSKLNLGLQVSWTSNPTDVTVEFRGTIDKVNYFLLGTFSGGSGGTYKSGDVLVSNTTPVIAVRADITALTGGTDPTVSASVLAY